MLDDFGFVQHFRVVLADIDLLRHVNNVAYLRWCETARSEYFHEVIGGRIDGQHGIIQAKIEFTYERQMRYREDVAVGCRVTRIGNKSFEIGYEIWSETQAVRCAYGATPLVAYDYLAQTTIAVPAEWRARILAFERVPPEMKAA
ncbi:MAG: acyl-CoA thioesterase [Vulcanimicrobiaceae bacterium]